MITTPLAQLITFGLDRWQLRHQDARERASRAAGIGIRLALGGLALAAMVAGVSVASTRLKTAVDLTAAVELERPFGDPRSKFYAWGSAAEMAMNYRWVGAGRGAYEQAFTQVYDRGGMARFPWVENGYLQSVTDWGVPVALSLLVLAGWSLLIALKRLEPDPLAAGALGAILALAVHEAADFSVELPGVGLPALAVLATLFARRSSESETGRRMLSPRLLWLTAPALVLVVALMAAFTPRAEAMAMDLRRELRDPQHALSELLPRAEAARRAHPADFYLHAIVAERLAREHHPLAMAWLNDAMFLNPSHPAPHLLAAELLAAAGHRSQALLEFKLAAVTAPTPMQVWDRVAQHYPDLSSLLATTTEDPKALVQLAGWLLRHKREQDATSVYERALTLSPHELVVLQELTRLALARRDAAAARRFLDLLLRLDQTVGSRLMAAKTSILEGDLDRAARELDDLGDQSQHRFDVEMELVVAYAKAGKRDRARQRLDRVTWASSRHQRVRLHETAAEIERQAGHQHQYEWEMEQASRLKRRTDDGR
jgi:tetratricopeptide (TPR) repeat protein